MADTIWIRGEGGGVHNLALPLHESIVDRMQKGYIIRVNPDGMPFKDQPDLPSKRPLLAAAKKVWVGWAVRNGMDPNDAEAATKQDLIERFGIDH